jgi:hypothetical protein
MKENILLGLYQARHSFRYNREIFKIGDGEFNI